MFLIVNSVYTYCITRERDNKRRIMRNGGYGHGETISRVSFLMSTRALDNFSLLFNQTCILVIESLSTITHSTALELLAHFSLVKDKNKLIANARSFTINNI